MEVIKYVAVKPDGSVMGPIGDTSQFVKTSLVIGYARAAKLNDIWNEEPIWKKIKELGYSIRKAKIIII